MKMTYKKRTASLLGALLLAMTMNSAAPQDKGDDVMTREGNMTVVNTTTLGKGVSGYNGPTPVKIYIKKNKVVRVEALRNEEGPKYMTKVRQLLLGQWDGMKVSQASKTDIDAVTGATFTSKAIKQNVKLGLDYYLKHK